MKSMGEVLFTKTQRRVLELLFGQSTQRYYGNELIRLAGVGTGSARSFLQNLVESELVMETKEGNQKYYQANPDSPIFEELRGIILKTIGLGEKLQRTLEPLQNKIEIAFIFGSIAKGSENAKSDVDVLIVSDELDYLDCMEILMPVSAEVYREINPSLYKVDEFQHKLSQQNHFLTKVLKQPKIMLIGTENDLEKFGKKSDS